MGGVTVGAGGGLGRLAGLGVDCSFWDGVEGALEGLRCGFSLNVNNTTNHGLHTV